MYIYIILFMINFYRFTNIDDSFGDIGIYVSY